MSDQAGATEGGFWADATGEHALDRYSTLVNMVDDGIYQLDAEGRFVAVNDTIVELTGYSREELLNEYASLVLADEDVSRIQHEIYRRLTDDDRRDDPIEFTARTADDDTIPCELELQLLIEDGAFQGSMGVVRDITERKQVERHLRQERELIDGIVETSPIGIAVVDHDGTVTFANERAEEIYGRSRNDLSKFSHDDTRFDLVDENGDPFKTGEAPFDRVVTQEEAIYDQVLGLRRPSGERIWVSVNGAPQWNEDDELVRAVFAFEDVTEQRENERKLEKSERRYRTLVQNFPNGSVGMFDEDMRYTAVGGQLLNSLGVVPEDRIGRTIHELHPDALVEQIEPYFQGALEGEADSFEIEFRGRHLHAHALPVRDATEEVFAGMLVVRDVTERKEHERELERNKDQLETLFDVLPVGVVVAEADGEIIEANNVAHEIWGGDVFDAGSVEEYEQYLVRWADSGEPVPPDKMTLARVVAGEEVTDPDIFEIETADGERRIVESEGIPIRDETGEVDRGVITMSDVTERKEAQRQLAESERLYRTLAEHFPNGVVGVYDHDLRYTLAAGEKIGDPAPSAEEVEGTRMPDLYPDDAVEDLEPLFRAAIEDGETGSIHTEVVGRQWQVWATPLRGANGEIFAGLSFAQDITEQVEHEQALEESEARFRMLAENLKEMVWISDPESREILYLNPAYEEIWGRDRESLYDDPTTFLQAVHPEDRERVEQGYAAVPDERFDKEYRIVRPNGEVRWLSVRAEPARSEGRERVVGIAEDITERKERERALEESERRYRTLVEHFPNGAVGLYNEDLEYTAVGGQLLDVTGVEPEDRIGKNVYEIYPNEVVEEIEPYLQGALEGEANSFEIEFHDRHLYAHTLPVRNADDDVFAGMLVVQDITERQEYERQLEESNERLEQFAYAASHDLQEPLRMVSSYLRLVENRYADELDEDGKEFIEFAIDGAERMREMIDGLLEYSRVDTRGDPFEPVDLDEVFADVRQDLQVKIQETDADITAEDLPQVYGDGSQLNQVFQNLLSNAIEYSGDEPPRVHVGAERDGDQWIISVSDEGIGIDPADAERVFEVFQSLQGHEGAGTGIGLALVKRIVERHDGDVWIDSVPGEGATFSFTLPAAGETNE
ncbi:PAS domain S-box protein [Halomontanus rarus]|uniref:PAS domain S-box protein n=1 Tax=Halomontanus rarus TaxID=3034020 RepID=UPI0023E80780|nr:PAS domain S-box protein [Halovivax sp. TS33]